jgi:hypothetical protein
MIIEYEFQYIFWLGKSDSTSEYDTAPSEYNFPVLKHVSFSYEASSTMNERNSHNTRTNCENRWNEFAPDIFGYDRDQQKNAGVHQIQVGNKFIFF